MPLACMSRREYPAASPAGLASSAERLDPPPQVTNRVRQRLPNGQAFAAATFGAAAFFGFFSANSKPTLPFLSVRCAENGRFFLEMNLGKRSVFPVAINFCACSFGISRCRIVLPRRKVHVLGEAIAFSHTYARGIS